MLKQKLTSSPILKLLDPKKNFIICIYAFIEGLGSVLMQGVMVIAYESCKLKDHENNYATHDIELAAIVYSLKNVASLFMG